MKHYYFIFLFSILFSGVSHSLAEQALNPLNTRLTEDSIDPDFCGNKHKNLVHLSTIDGVKVPEFIGVSTSRVEQFLRKHNPDIFNDYTNAIHLITNQKATEAEATLLDIQEKIKACFNTFDFNFISDELALFQRIAAQKQFFMVRSTGFEDGAVANAGGNVSIAYVVPEASTIKQAMGEVVASYFGMQSLKNRMGGNEQLSNTLCLPVLIQLLIGETFDGNTDIQNIPISGVAYTTNPSLSSPNFAVTEINAAYGHGEGVVANRVIADRYYITASQAKPGDISLYPMLYHKQERLVPHHDMQTNKYTLIPIQNSDAIAYKSALSQEQVKALYDTLKKIEAHYEQPMDVEFIVIGATIYIVQARPAMHVAMQPSYIDFDKVGNNISATVQGTIIVPGTAQVLIISNPQDILITKTLDEADQKSNSTTCKAVVVDTWASSLSHAAVNFKTYGTPCMVVQDLTAIKKLIAQITPQTPLIIDVQQRSLFIWTSTQKGWNSALLQGWLEHPIDRAISLWIEGKSHIHTSCANPLPHDGKLIKLLESFKISTNTQQQKELLTLISERVHKRLALTERRIQHIGSACGEELKAALSAFKLQFQALMQEFTASIEQQSDRFAFLFYHKMLEALLYQASDARIMLGAYNYAHFLNNLYERQIIFMATLMINHNNGGGNTNVQLLQYLF